MAHILIIDDDPAVRSLFGQFLDGEGYSTALAADGREALELLQTRRPDVIITDIMMPEMDGLEVIQNIRKNYAEIPVVAISGGMKGVPINFLPHAKKMGALCVFEKPVSLANLLQTVRKLTGATSTSGN